MLWVLFCKVHLTVCFCHVTYAFQSESTLYSCLNVKELVALSRREIWSLRDCNWTQTHNHLVLKQTLNHLTKLYLHLWTKWLWVQVQLQSLKLHISHLLQAKSSLAFKQLECRFSLKRVRDMMRTHNQMHRTDKYSKCSSII